MVADLLWEEILFSKCENRLSTNLLHEVGLGKGMSNLKYWMWEVSADAEHLKLKCFHKDFGK